MEKIEARPQTLRQIALDRVRDAIMEGQIAPGERLVERTLGDRLGVSRSVIREVIRNLESEGLVENSAAGPRLSTISSAQARQIYEIRVQLESSAVAACAKVATATTVADLREALAAIGAAHAAGSPVDALRASTRFYEIIFITGEHDIAWEIVQRLNSRISQMRAMTLSVVGRQAAGLKRLSRIVDAIANKNADAAAEACREHVLEAGSIAIEMLKNR
ncbi:GntR family transcriptional regulator [Novosphingobium sp. P6W]|uniref:GntR family transcriptional regulator n=1 Tax=Novosphingobium sp. P6W TaxID=1609758 RepID=UPI000A8EAE73|nr:GntR family transcriptional regulator [Novosphingobium sp. P6W]